MSGDSGGDGAPGTDPHRTDSHHIGADRTDSMRSDAEGTSDGTLRERVKDLEGRVAELEARESARDELAEERYTVDTDNLGSDDPDDGDASGAESHAIPPRGDGRDQPSDAPHGGEEDESGALDAEVLSNLETFLASRAPKKDHGKRAVVVTLQVLREHAPEAVSTGEIMDEVYSRGNLAEHYSGDRTMWNSISRYLDDIPGFEKAGYGEWRYAGDDALREGLSGE